MKSVSQSQASRLLHNKFVVVLGDSIQRSVYKDLVLLLQKDKYLTVAQLKSKGEMSFEQDCLVEGGRLGTMNNGTEYREVRQFRSDHHLVRFYFLTRIYSRYMESILADFENGLKPDVIIINSCVWDLSRYGQKCLSEYRENLQTFFEKLKKGLPSDCLMLWSMAMPLGSKIVGGFLVPEIEHMAATLRHDVIEANFYAATLADAFGMDVLDLHYHFRFGLQHRAKDGVHWNSGLLLRHAAHAWGVELGEPSNPDVIVSDVPLTMKPKTKAKQKQIQAEHTLLCSFTQPPALDPYRYGGPCGHHGYTDRYMEAPIPVVQPSQYAALPWPQHPSVHYGGPGYPNSFFYEDPPIGYMSMPFAPGYISFDDYRRPVQASGNFGGSQTVKPMPYQPAGPENHFVMKKKSAKNHYAPYTRHRPYPSYR